MLNDHNFRKLSTEVGFGQNGQKDIKGRKAQENILMALGKKSQEAKLG